jgi:anti-anti-sigma factor
MQDRCLVASLEGEIDLSNAAEIAQDLFRSIPNSARGVVIDLSETQYIDSQGVRFLLELLERLEIRHQKSRLVVPIGSPLRKLFRIVSIAATTAIAPSIPIAVEEIKREL